MGGEVEIDSDTRGGFQLRRDWWRVRRLAENQHRTIARRQLIAAGLSPWQIDRLVAAGYLRSVHLGIYAIGHGGLTQHGEWMAAVLSGGPGGFLSHLAAAMLWELIESLPSLPHVTTPTRGRRRRGIINHTAHLPSDEITLRDRIPVTKVSRTLFDLAATLDPLGLEQAVAQAQFHGYALTPSLPELLRRYPGHRGNATLRAVLASGNASLGPARSPLETRFLRFLDERRLQRPELNVPMTLAGERIKVDCLWRRLRIALELDGRAAHMRVQNFESDRLRDRRLSAAGWRPVRVTDQQLEDDPEGLEADLRALGVDRDTVPA